MDLRELNWGFLAVAEEKKNLNLLVGKPGFDACYLVLTGLLTELVDHVRPLEGPITDLILAKCEALLSAVETDRRIHTLRLRTA